MSYSSQLITAYHHLATMLDAGLPILRAFDTVTTHARGSFRRVLIRVKSSLSEGNTVSEAFAEFPKVFARFDRTMIKSADESGNLDTCFAMLSEWYEFLRRIKRIIISGLLLPFFVLHFAVIIYNMVFVFLGDVPYQQGIVNILVTLAWMIYVPLFIVWFAFTHGNKIPGLRELIDTIALLIPVLGKGVKELCISRFAKAFNMLYKAGVPISESFSLALPSTGNYLVGRMFKGGVAKIAEGKVLSAGFSRSVPIEYIDLWAIGEETGELDRCVDKIAEIASGRAELYLQEIAKWIPRLIYFGFMMMMIKMIFVLAQRYTSTINSFF